MDPHASFTSDSLVPDQLVVSGPRVSRKVTIVNGQNLKRGAVIGQITAGGKYILSLSDAEDGSEVPDLVLAHDVFADGADAEATAYEDVDVNGNALILGAAHTLASIREGLRVKGVRIHLAQPR